ncbi:MAG TPA: bifunctional alpha/beta hydrolase/OsmC family protein [Brevundimonas sp.]|jgi:putative redox protein|uniref:bifunctional alpha/beta hydrolase/OsmC family protein n=1 Tax=Brevundimonas sp. TaxID=1871086 RepID=UPI002E129519|nr:bifunctional alpha/beta hydrolase/OsmC family protein [Brevundimonas sp.]
MQSEPLDFVTPGGRAVRARLDRPAGQARAWALFAHCFTCGKDNLAATRIARALAAEGVGTLRLDFAGLGDGPGDPAAPAGFSCDVGDLVAAAGHLAKEGCAPQLLVGHSLGGAAVIAAAGQIDSVRAVAVIGAPFDPDHVLKVLGAEGLAAEQHHEADLGGRPVRVSGRFAEDLRAQDQGARLRDLDRALLVLHSPRDEIVSIDEAGKIFVAARHPKSFVSLDDADHLLSDAADAAYAAKVIAGWASRYLEAVPAEAPGAPADGTVRVTETGAGRFQVQVEAGGAVLLADEPTSVGGLGSGPNPYELVAAGLGACTAMTLRLYAEHKGAPLTRVGVEVRHAKRKGETPADLFERTLTLEGELDAAQRARMLEIADRCPVHRTLEGGAAIVTTLEPPRVAPEGETAHFADMDRACAR